MRKPTSGGFPVRIRLDAQGSAPNLAMAIDAALTVLTEARRIRRVGAGEGADVVHAVGTLTGDPPATARRVQTVERLPLRSNGRDPCGWWRRRARGLAPSVSAWVTHGQTAGHLLVTAGIAGSRGVHCLPLLAPPEPEPSRAADVEAHQARACLRRRLDLAPGVHLVVGLEPGRVHPSTAGWMRALRSRGRRDIAVGELREVDGAPGRFSLRLTGRPSPSMTGDLATLLPGVDVYVAADQDLTACSPAPAVVDAGIPIVTVATDSAQDLVLSGAVGRMTQLRSDAIAETVLTLVDDGLCSRRPIGAPTDGRRRTVDLAHQLLQIYRQVGAEPMTGGAR